MKKAFTMIELVFVIVIVGIISVMIAPNFQGNNLRQAADQLVSHIRYTQHLAMMDNKFSTDPEWFKGRWQIQFHENLTYAATNPPAGTYNDVWSYSIYSDSLGYTKNPGLAELAINPLNSEAYFTGGYNNVLHIESDQDKITENMQLGNKYGIEDINIFCSNLTGSNFPTRIIFDNLGRPYCNYNGTSKEYDYLLNAQATIELVTTDANITIAIEPETGYTHIL